MESGVYLLTLVLIFGSGGNDLLDHIPSDAYWKAKGVTPTVESLQSKLEIPKAGDISALIKDLGSEVAATRDAAKQKIRGMGPGVIEQLKTAAKSSDAEVATSAVTLISELDVAVRADEVARLMAIRTLGEMKAKGASASIRLLLTSKEPFVADYAAQALAAIEGKTYDRPAAAAKDRAADAALFPKDTHLLAQLSFRCHAVVSFGDLQKRMGPMAKEFFHNEDADKAAAEMTAAAISFAERAGNARLDAITVGVVGSDAGTRHTRMILRGQYDPVGFSNALKRMLTEGEDTFKSEMVGDIEIISDEDGESCIIPVSPDRLLTVASSASPSPTLPMARQSIAALKAGKGGIADNTAMQALLKTIDTTKPLWLAFPITDADRAEMPEILQAFGTLAVEGDITATGVMTLSITGKWTDAGKAKAATDTVNAGVAEALKDAKESAKTMEQFKPIVAALGSVKISTNGGTSSATGSMKDAGPATLLPMILLALPHSSTEAAPMAPG